MSRRRNKITATLVPFLFLTLICVAAIAPAALVDTFDAPLPAATAQADGSGPAPAVQSGGPTGDFLRLVYDGQNSQNNQYAYDQTDAGLFSTIVTQFDFRAFSAAANQAADGFSFALIPTADWGTSGAGPGYTAEEPNIPGMFGLGFDLHPADGATPVNDVSIHFNNVEVHNVKRDPASEIDLDNNQFHRAQLTLQQVGNSTNATLILSPDVYGAPGSPVTAIEHVIPMMQPFDNRVMFRGRTGGRNVDVDLDNVDVQYSNPAPVLPTYAGGTLFQDFDSAGATNFAAKQWSLSTPTLHRPGPIAVAGGPTGAFMRLSHDGVNTSRNAIAFDQAALTGIADATQRITFDFRLSSAGNAADGFSLALLPTATYGASGNGPDKGDIEKPDYAGTFGVGFRLHPEESGVNDVSIHWDGSERRLVRYPTGEIDLRQTSPVFHRAQVDVEDVAGGARVTVNLTRDVFGTPAAVPLRINEFFVPGMSAYEYRVMLAGRTGGRYVSTDVDNISAVALPNSMALDFEGEFGSVYQLHGFNANWTPQVQSGGPTGNYVRLTQDGVGSQSNGLVLDQTPNQRGLAQGYALDFDFRVTHDPGNGGGPADGVGLLLLPVDAHGAGAVAVASNEEANLAGALGIGLDTYFNSNNADDPDANHVSLHWNNAVAQVFDSGALQGLSLSAGVFHHARLRVEQVTGGSNVTVVLTPDVHGAAGAPVTLGPTYIAGMNAYQFRTQFVARTGGATQSADLDNIAGQRLAPASTYATQQGFEGFDDSGTDFHTRKYVDGSSPAILNGGPTGNFLRLIHDGQTNNRNAVAFDTAPAAADAADGIPIQFDFRGTNGTAGASPADGFAMMLIPTAQYGDTGPGAYDGVSLMGIEEPNLANIFAIGFDFYNAADGVNDVSVHWNGTELRNVRLDATTQIDLDAGVFHHVDARLVENPGGGVQVFVTLTPDVFGAPGVPIDLFAAEPGGYLLISDMSFYDYRVELAGRTGGSHMSIDIDNVLVPEPTAALLMAIGLAMWGLVRRGRK